MAACVVLVSPASAQPASDAWQVTVEPYLMGAAMSGTSGVHRPRGGSRDVGLGHLSNLEFGAMGIVGARKGNWASGTDLIFMSLGSTTDRPAADLDFAQSALAFSRHAPNQRCRRGHVWRSAPTAWMAASPSKRDALVPAGTTRSQSKWWFDPIVGLRLHSNSSGRFNAAVYGEVGGFGVGSDFAWQIFPAVSVRVAGRTSLEVGYRWLDVNYADDEGAAFTWDMLSQGPVMGFKFKF